MSYIISHPLSSLMVLTFNPNKDPMMQGLSLSSSHR